MKHSDPHDPNPAPGPREHGPHGRRSLTHLAAAALGAGVAIASLAGLHHESAASATHEAPILFWLDQREADAILTTLAPKLGDCQLKSIGVERADFGEGPVDTLAGRAICRVKD